MSTFRLLVAYDGSAYAGYAVQPGLPTVQGQLEAALERIAGEAVRVATAGRTDSGVHALGQVVSFEAPDALTPERIAGALGAQLPPDISVLDAAPAPEGFHARHSCVSRTYAYLIWNHASRNPLIDRFVVREDRRLDTDAIDDALRHVVGTHDFSALARVRVDQDPMRTVMDAGAEREGDLVRIRVTARSFLHQMVRNIVGTVLDVGVGRRPPEWVAEVIASRERSAAGQTMKPHGLTLVEAAYDGVDWPNRPATAWPWATTAPLTI